ncbi:hypothetical protein GCM10009868_39310 [Terrabacter aerolatus]|uniref:Uncharacterized protein n=1 Tax=Terrabacter aerolatus TaxID=422442 RepID=A0A512D0E7_9MICO|nr:hypothetical protein [Terrabacter aerolatus]GEO29936.1 hypothetical protein TAE01_17460 [Terrabacter aerolatus]
MFSQTSHASIADLVAAWPLVLLAMAFASIVARAFVRANRPVARESSTGWGEAGPKRICRTAGHHYLKRETGWRCSQCGDEIRRYVGGTRGTPPAHRNGELAGV